MIYIFISARKLVILLLFFAKEIKREKNPYHYFYLTSLFVLLLPPSCLTNTGCIFCCGHIHLQSGIDVPTAIKWHMIAKNDFMQVQSLR